MLTLQELKNLGRQLTSFLAMFAGCFASSSGRWRLRIDVCGQLASDIPRKNCEAIAVAFRPPVRTLQRFLESLQWNEEQLRDQCQQVIAREHAHPQAIGTVDESGTAKSGSHTAAVGRQDNGHRGKVENCTVGVHLGYATPEMEVLLDSRRYLPQDWANDPARRKKTTSPTTYHSQPSRKLRWAGSTGPWATASRWRPGPAMNCMAATATSSTAWTSETRRL